MSEADLQPIRLMISARDPGAAQSLIPVIRSVADDRRFAMVLVASGHAVAAFRRAGFTPTVALAPPIVSAEDPGRAGLLQEAAALLDRFKPQVLLVGLSGPDAGLDEALLVVADRKIPTLALQDYWGDVNLTMGQAAETYLVADSFAAKVTASRFGLSAEVVGQPRYASFGPNNLEVARQQARGAYSIGENSLVGFFGQDLWHCAGYSRSIEQVAASLATILPDALFVYRRHPKEGASGAQRALEIAENVGAKALEDTNQSFMDLLVGCDLVLSVYSSSCYDAAQLNRASPNPLFSPIYLLFEKDVRDLVATHTGFETLPPVDLGVCAVIDHAEDVTSTLREGLNDPMRRQLWSAARDSLPSQEHAVDKILATLHARAAPDQVVTIR